MATNRFFDGGNLGVIDGQLARASQLNALTAETNNSFELVEAEMNLLSEQIQDAANWATGDQGLEVDPTNYPGGYSSRANAEEAQAWAASLGGTSTEADGVTLIPKSAKEYAVDTASDLSDTNADVVLTGIDVGLTGDDVDETNADVVLAEAAQLLAGEWAENPENDEVTGYAGQYSALHWATKAEAAAALIEPAEDTIYGGDWDAVTAPTSKNTLYDKFQLVQGVIDAKVQDLSYSTVNWSGVTTIAPSADSVFDKIQDMISDTAYGSSWEPYTVTAPSKGAIYDKIELITTDVTDNKVNSFLETTATGDATWTLDFSVYDCQNLMYLDRATTITLTNIDYGKTVVLTYYSAATQTITWAGEDLRWASGVHPPAKSGWTMVTITKVWSYSLASFSNGFAA